MLVVDDDRAISRLIRSNLESESITVIEAASGLEAISRLRQGAVDLVLLDISLPDFSGWGILSLLRLSRHDIPVIIVSVEPPDAALVAQFCPEDYVQKPFDITDLLARVRRVLAARSPRADKEIIIPGIRK